MDGVEVAMFDVTTVKFNPVFIDSLPISLSNYIHHIKRDYEVDILITEELGYECAGHVKQICLFMDEFPSFLKSVRKAEFLEKQAEQLEQAKRSKQSASAFPVDLLCPLCEFKTQVRKSFTKHIASHKALNKIDSHSPTMFFKCSACFDHTEYLSCYIRHVESVHQIRKPLLCEICGLAFTRADNLRSHKHSVHSGQSSSVGKYKCKKCAKTFKTKARLTDHQLVHMNEKMYSCDICLRPFKTIKSLNRHIQYTHEAPRSHVCDTCGAAFNIKQSLQVHQAKVHMDKEEKERIATQRMTERLTSLIRHDLDSMAADCEGPRCAMEDEAMLANHNGEDEAMPGSTEQVLSGDTVQLPDHNVMESLSQLISQPPSEPGSADLASHTTPAQTDQVQMDLTAVCQSISDPPSGINASVFQPIACASPAGSSVSMRSNDGFSSSRNQSYSDFQHLQQSSQPPNIFSGLVDDHESTCPDEDGSTELDELLKMPNDPPSGPQSIVSQLSRPPSVSSVPFLGSQSQTVIHIAVGGETLSSNHSSSFTDNTHTGSPPSYEQSLSERLGRQTSSYSHSQASVFQPIVSSSIITSYVSPVSCHMTHSHSAPALQDLQHNAAPAVDPVHQAYPSFSVSSSPPNPYVHDILMQTDTHTFNSTPQNSLNNDIDCITTVVGNPVIVTDVIDSGRDTPCMLQALNPLPDAGSPSESRLLASNVEAINQLHTPTKDFPPPAYNVATSDDGCTFSSPSLPHSVFSSQ